MNKKIIFSLALIGVAAAIAIGGTVAYFSDTETSVGNTFTAGTIDISIDGQNPWTDTFTLADMKPCYTDYINFKIENDLSDPNPVNIFKKIIVTGETTGAISEPECEAEGGTWTVDNACGNGNGTWVPEDDLSSVIWYDLSVEVYNASNELIWHQVIYKDSDKKSIDDVYANGEVFLGMIPAGGHMLVEQSYHLKPEAGNEYQGDLMTFSIEIKGEQLYGIAWLDNKINADGQPGSVYLTPDDEFEGTLEYEVKGPEFDFKFTGKAPKAGEWYVLAAGYDSGSNVDTYLGDGYTDANGDITIEDSIELNKDMKDVKVWLVTEDNWDWIGEHVTGWGNMGYYLWETGLIWYEDTDL